VTGRLPLRTGAGLAALVALATLLARPGAQAQHADGSVGVAAPPRESPGAEFRPGGQAAGAMADLFKDGTLQYLPLKEWDLGDIETGDLNGDGLEDIVFSITHNDACDSIPGTRPRIWIQNRAGRFVDETATRIPFVSTSTRDLDLIDAEGDGDLDILLGGHRCLSQYSPGTLLINDGNGNFTDETESRLLAVPEFTYLYSIAVAPIDSGDSPDIATVLYDPVQGIAYPYLFLNTGNGIFWPDNRGRLLEYGPYGFNGVEAVDLTGDGFHDLLFLNAGIPADGMVGGLALFVNNGAGFFADETAARVGRDSARITQDVAFGDVDGDGDTDILDVGKFSTVNDPQVRLLLNDGSGTFNATDAGDISGLSGWFNDAEFAHFSQDSLPDLFLGKVRPADYDSDVLLLNHGGGVFRDSSELLPSVLDFTVSVAVFDYDRDGDPDIIVGNSNPRFDLPGQNRLYINQRLSPPAAVDDPGGVPRSAALIGNYPNPFNPSTVIRYSLDAGADVTIVVANVLGEVVMRSGPGHQPAGTHEFRWDAAGHTGGVYWYSLLVDGRRIGTRPALLVR
jgi:hypothetical protein